MQSMQTPSSREKYSVMTSSPRAVKKANKGQGSAWLIQRGSKYTLGNRAVVKNICRKCALKQDILPRVIYIIWHFTAGFVLILSRNISTQHG